MDTLVEKLVRDGTLRTKRVIDAFRAIDRKDFVPAAYAGEAYEDYPLPIGHDQTISQPTTVAFMLELLAPKPGENILDVGSGSGWTTALLAEIAGVRGTVIGVERIPELVSFGSKNLAKYAFPNARIVEAGAKLGFPEESPYDRILVSAGAERVLNDLMEELADGGIMVIPVLNGIEKIKKRGKTFSVERFEGFVFVPLIE